MHLISFDIETLGLDRRAPVIEIAGVYYDTLIKRAHQPAWRTFAMICRPDWNEFVQSRALEMHLKSGLLEMCFNATKDHAQMWDEFLTWLDNVREISRMNHGEKFVLLGKNVGSFDMQFMPDEVREQFHHRCIDIGPLFAAPWMTHPPSLDDIIAQHVIKSSSVSHRALEDATDVLNALLAHPTFWNDDDA